MIARACAILFTAFCAAAPASAQFALGGHAIAERFFDGNSPYTSTTYRANLLASMTIGTTVFGAGTDLRLGQDSAGNYPARRDYGLIAHGPFTLTYGEIYGAGSMLPEDYFALSDATGRSDEVGRLQVDLDTHAFAISNDFNGSDPSELELGYAGRIGRVDVRAGVEFDSGDVGVLLAQDQGGWQWNLFALRDWDSSGLFDDQLAGTLFVDIGRANVGFHYAWAPKARATHSLGLVATYPVGEARIKAEYFDVRGSRGLALGVMLPIGQAQPGAKYRQRFDMFRRGTLY